MRSRLIRNSFLMAVIPLAAMILSSVFRNSQTLTGIFVLAGVAAQIPVVLICKRCMRRLIRPDEAILLQMGTTRIPAAYEPGKFKTDFKVAGGCMWLGAAAPVLTFLAYRFTHEVTFDIPGFVPFTAPNYNLLMLALACVLFGSLALIFWFKVGQAMEIANEGNDGRRYLLRGFCEEMEEEKSSCVYLNLLKQEAPISMGRGSSR